MNTKLKRQCVAWCVVVFLVVCGAGWLYERVVPAEKPAFDIYNMKGISLQEDLIQRGYDHE